MIINIHIYVKNKNRNEDSNKYKSNHRVERYCVCGGRNGHIFARDKDNTAVIYVIVRSLSI